MRSYFLYRIAALFLSLSFSLPCPVYALRPQHVGLEEIEAALGVSTGPSVDSGPAGLEELGPVKFSSPDLRDLYQLQDRIRGIDRDALRDRKPARYSLNDNEVKNLVGREFRMRYYDLVQPLVPQLHARAREGHSTLVSWIGARPKARARANSLMLRTTQELAQLAPDWPVPYLLQVVRNDPGALSLTLFDVKGLNIIEMNLHRSGDAVEPEAIILGESPRIDPDYQGYPKKAKPSDLTKRWLVEKVTPWLASRGKKSLVVKAYFDTAQDFFRSIGFVADPHRGKPYVRLALQDRSRARTRAVRSRHAAGLEEKTGGRNWRKPAAAGAAVAAAALAAGGLALGASQKPETPQLPPQRLPAVSQPAPRGQGAPQTIISFLKNPEALIHLNLADLRVKRPQHFYWFQLNKASFQWLEFERQEDFQQAFAGIHSFLARHRGSYPLPPGAYSLEFLASYFSQAPSGSLAQFEQEFLRGLQSRALLSDRWKNFSGKGPRPLPRYIPSDMDMISVRVITKPVVIGAGWQMNLHGRPVDREERAKRVRAAWRFYTHQQVYLTTQVASEQSLIGIKLKPDRDSGWFHVKRTKQAIELYWLEFQWEREYRETFTRIQKFAENHREGDLASSGLYSLQLLADYFSTVPRYKQDLSEGQRFTLSYLEVALLEHLRVRRLLFQRGKRWVATGEAILGIGWQRDTQGKLVNPEARMSRIDSALQRYRSRRPPRAGLEEVEFTSRIPKGIRDVIANALRNSNLADLYHVDRVVRQGDEKVHRSRQADNRTRLLIDLYLSNADLQDPASAEVAVQRLIGLASQPASSSRQEAGERRQGSPPRDFRLLLRDFQSGLRVANQHFLVYQRLRTPEYWRLFLEKIEELILQARQMSQMMESSGAAAFGLDFQNAYLIAHAAGDPFTPEEQQAIEDEIRYLCDQFVEGATDVSVREMVDGVRPVSLKGVAERSLETVETGSIVFGMRPSVSVFSHFLDQMPHFGNHLGGLTDTGMQFGGPIRVASGMGPSFTAAVTAHELWHLFASLWRPLDLSRLGDSLRQGEGFSDVLLGLALARRGQLQMLNQLSHHGIQDSVSFQYFYRVYVDAREITQRYPDSHARWRQMELRIRRSARIPAAQPIPERLLSAARAGELHQLGERLAQRFGEESDPQAAFRYAYQLFNKIMHLPVRAAYSTQVQNAFDQMIESSIPRIEETQVQRRFQEIWGAFSRAAREADRLFRDYAWHRRDQDRDAFREAVENMVGVAAPLRILIEQEGEGMIPERLRGTAHAMLQVPGGDFTPEEETAIHEEVAAFVKAWKPEMSEEERNQLASGVQPLGLKLLADMAIVQAEQGIMASGAGAAGLRSAEFSFGAWMDFLAKGRGMHIMGLRFAVQPEASSLLSAVSLGLGASLASAIAVHEVSHALASELIPPSTSQMIRGQIPEEISEAVLMLCLVRRNALGTLQNAALFGLSLPIYQSYLDSYEEGRRLAGEGVALEQWHRGMEAALQEISRRPHAQGLSPLRGVALAARAQVVAEKLGEEFSFQEDREQISHVAYRYLYRYAAASGSHLGRMQTAEAGLREEASSGQRSIQLTQDQVLELLPSESNRFQMAQTIYGEIRQENFTSFQEAEQRVREVFNRLQSGSQTNPNTGLEEDEGSSVAHLRKEVGELLRAGRKTEASALLRTALAGLPPSNRLSIQEERSLRRLLARTFLPENPREAIEILENLSQTAEPLEKIMDHAERAYAYALRGEPGDEERAKAELRQAEALIDEETPIELVNLVIQRHLFILPIFGEHDAAHEYLRRTRLYHSSRWAPELELVTIGLHVYLNIAEVRRLAPEEMEEVNHLAQTVVQQDPQQFKIGWILAVLTLAEVYRLQADRLSEVNADDLAITWRRSSALLLEQLLPALDAWPRELGPILKRTWQDHKIVYERLLLLYRRLGNEDAAVRVARVRDEYLEAIRQHYGDLLDAAGLEEDVREMAVWPLLEVLGLQDLQRFEGAEVIPVLDPQGNPIQRLPESFWPIKRIRLSARDRTQLPKGLQILQAIQKEKEPNQFDLLYNEKGQVIAAFPVFGDPEAGKMSPGLQFYSYYLDLGNYYWVIPPFGVEVPDAMFAAFESQRESNDKAIEAYKKLMDFPKGVKGLPEHPGYLYLELGKGPERPFSFKADLFHPWSFREEFQERNKKSEGKFQVIYPLYPAVPSPSLAYDLGYYAAVRDFSWELQESDDILIPFVGGGLDAWISAMVSEKKVYVADANPLAIADVRALQIASSQAGLPFEFESEVADVFSFWQEGKRPFGGRRWKRIFGNAPSVVPVEHPPVLERDLKGMVDRFTVGDFSGFARALPYLLTPDGEAFIWNPKRSAPQPGGQGFLDLAAEIFKSAGTFDPDTLSSGKPDQLVVEAIPYPAELAPDELPHLGDVFTYRVRLPSNPTGLEERGRQELEEVRSTAASV